MFIKSEKKIRNQENGQDHYSRILAEDVGEGLGQLISSRHVHWHYCELDIKAIR